MNSLSPSLAWEKALTKKHATVSPISLSHHSCPVAQSTLKCPSSHFGSLASNSQRANMTPSVQRILKFYAETTGDRYTPGVHGVTLVG